jgi:cell division transport system permease protein
MKISTFFRHLREGTRSLVRNGWMTFASIGAIAISLFILGVFLILSLNMTHLARQIESQVEIRVFLEVNTPQERINALHNEIAAIPGVRKVTFVSRDEGLEFMRNKLGESGKQLLEGLDGENNPLNDSFTVEAGDPHDVPAIARQIQAINDNRDPKPIYKVNYGQGAVETLFKVTNIIRNVGLLLVTGLALTAMFLIANTIKLTIFARNREISIMKLVGATNSFIRWPFFIEGALLGLIGSVIPAALLLYGYSELLNASRVELSLLMIELKPLKEIGVTLTALLLGIGIMIGIWGTLLSVRRFLRV